MTCEIRRKYSIWPMYLRWNVKSLLNFGEFDCCICSYTPCKRRQRRRKQNNNKHIENGHGLSIEYCSKILKIIFASSGEAEKKNKQTECKRAFSILKSVSFNFIQLEQLEFFVVLPRTNKRYWRWTLHYDAFFVIFLFPFPYSSYERKWIIIRIL